MPMVIGLPTLQPSSNSVSRGRFRAQFLRAVGERSPLGEGVPPGVAPGTQAAQGVPIYLLLWVSLRNTFWFKIS